MERAMIIVVSNKEWNMPKSILMNYKGNSDRLDTMAKELFEEYKVKEKSMTVGEFCLRKTQVGELCVFREDDWIIGSTWIDHEDLFTMSDNIRKKAVKSNEWGTLTITTEHGDKIDVPCHYIDF